VIESRVEWHGPEQTERIRLVTLEAITRATVELWNLVQTALNVPNTGERVKYKHKRTPKGRPASHTIYPHPSRPGEPPRKRTGFLQRNVKYEITPEGVGRVGVVQNARYGAYLELGTRRVQARPWLLATVRANLDRLRAIIFGAAGGGGT
jgi:hypothetical protein